MQTIPIPKPIECPRCEGLGSTVDPRYRRQDPKCGLCEGRGYVTDQVCRGCGRPAYLDASTGLVFCGRKSCIPALAEPVKRVWKVRRPEPVRGTVDRPHNQRTYNDYLYRGFEAAVDDENWDVGMPPWGGCC